MTKNLIGTWVHKEKGGDDRLHVEFAHSGIVSGEFEKKSMDMEAVRGRFYFSEHVLEQQYTREDGE